MAADFALPHDFATDATAAVDAVLTQEAGRIGADIHKATLHTSPWMDLHQAVHLPRRNGLSTEHPHLRPCSSAVPYQQGLN